MTDFFEAVARRRWNDLMFVDKFDDLDFNRRLDLTHEARIHVAAHLAELEARGMKVVPLYSTDAMQDEAVSCGQAKDRLHAEFFWSAMLAAAPPAPGSET